MHDRILVSNTQYLTEFKAFNTYEAAQEYLDAARPLTSRGGGRNHVVDNTQSRLATTLDATT